MLLTLSVALFAGTCSVEVPQAGGPELPQEAMALVSVDRCRDTVDRLVTFGTRHTLSEGQSGPRGITAARAWIMSEFELAAANSGGRMTVLESRAVVPAGARVPSGATVVNAVAILKGEGAGAARRIYVLGHYDNRNGDPMDTQRDAPGANDDASGTTVVMESARALAPFVLESTIVFVCTSGEEQGLLGARIEADGARAANYAITGVLSYDIVGDPTSPMAPGVPGREIVRVFSEGLPRSPDATTYAQLRSLAMESDSPSRQLARYVAEVGAWERTAVHPKLIFRADRFLRGGDHTPFNESGFAAVRFTETDENYDRQHQDVRVETKPDGTQIKFGDTAEFVDAAYVADVTMLNVASVVHLANAPSAPSRVRVLTAQLTNTTTLRWDASPEPDVAGYEVVWRETTSPTWDHSRPFGKVGEATIELSKDDWFFGVRAIDRDGYRSQVRFAAAAAE